MNLIVTEDNAGFLTAAYIRDRIKKFNPSRLRPFVLALPTGATSLDLYEHLVRFHKEGALSFENVVTFNLDEYVGLDTGHPQSYHSFMRRNFSQLVNIAPQNVNIPNGNAADLAAECRAYEEKIKNLGGIELLIGGVGVNGHIAFNEPGSAFDSLTRVVDLAPSTRRANARFFDNDINLVPKQAVTVGLGTILRAREIIIMALGVTKAEAVRRAVEGQKDENWSITALKGHARVYIVADKDAASEVSSDAALKCGVCSFALP